MSRHVAPGYCIVQRPGTLDHQARLLFNNRNSDAARLFMKNNADTPWLKPGQIVIVVDPNSSPTLRILHTLRQAKQKTNRAVAAISSSEAHFMHQHYGMIAALTGAGDKIFSTAGNTGEKYFIEIEKILKKLESCYQNQYLAQGTLISHQFYAERRQLLNQLKELVNKPLLRSLARHTVKFRPYEDMRRALNLSSRSIMHHWSTAGVVGGIPGYAHYVGNAAKAAKFLKIGGYIGIAFALAGTTNDVIDACTTGREGECGKFTVKHYGRFIASTAAGLGAGYAGAGAGLGICVAIGIVTAGAGGVACAAVGSIAAGYASSQIIEWTIDSLYNYFGV